MPEYVDIVQQLHTGTYRDDVFSAALHLVNEAYIPASTLWLKSALKSGIFHFSARKKKDAAMKSNEDIYKIEDPYNGAGLDAIAQSLVTAQELAEYLNCCTKTVYTMVKDGRIPMMKVGNRYRFDPAEVEKALLLGVCNSHKK